MNIKRAVEQLNKYTDSFDPYQRAILTDMLKALAEPLECEHNPVKSYMGFYYCNKCHATILKSEECKHEVNNPLNTDDSNLLLILTDYLINTERADKEQKLSGVYAEYKQGDAMNEAIRAISSYKMKGLPTDPILSVYEKYKAFAPHGVSGKQLTVIWQAICAYAKQKGIE